ncbi:glycoside hydrolase family protein [Cupriavidus alkaliphilus]|uniref:glycoside hydrolase family protein n=1 Tax=Cupriavidus alkaliphilus TaxID=942866 RepID=UPI0008158AD1|nr:glycoside hydrolase family protein [Cupriavidus alkaliphilus]SCB10364.1 Phage-related lysozyme (muramidase), GH24 family [Cupriavidus alkaliphilus]
MSRQRIAVALLTISAAGFGVWKSWESFTGQAVIPTRGDVPTLGYGSTRYEDGRPVRMGDSITRERAEVLARNLMKADERQLAASLPGVKLYQAEFDVYADFVGQFGIGNWRASTMRRRLLAGDYAGACDALLRYRFSAGFDCSTPGNKRCYGVWARQMDRHRKCVEAQP